MKKTIIQSILFILLILFFVKCQQEFYGDNDNAFSGKNSEMNYSGDYNDNGSGVGGSMARFAIEGDYLYTVNSQDMNVFSISDPSSPVLANSFNAGFNIETIFSRDSLLFLGAQNGMYIYDIKQATNPFLIVNYQHVYSCDPVVVDDKYAYVTLHSQGSNCGRFQNELQIIDISNLYFPYTVKTYPMTNPLGLGIDNKTLFICDNGLKVYDVTDVYYIKLKQHFLIKATDVIPLGGKLFVIGEDGFYQYKYTGTNVELLSKITVVKNE